MPKDSFLRTWSSIAYLFPGLHPDEVNNPNGGWPMGPRRIASEAWRRFESGEIDEDELYPSDASWAGIFDRMVLHLPDETERRIELASRFGRA